MLKDYLQSITKEEMQLAIKGLESLIEGIQTNQFPNVPKETQELDLVRYTNRVSLYKTLLEKYY